MIRLFQLMIFGHVHKWKIIDKANMWGANAARADMPTGLVYIQQCEHCGKVIRRTLDS